MIQVRYAVWVYSLAGPGAWIQTGTPDNHQAFGYATLYHSAKRAEKAAKRETDYWASQMPGVPREDWYKIVPVECNFVEPPTHRK